MGAPLKRSRQRDTILACVMKHHDHPTADVIYKDAREYFPNISLGTVYRNLSLLTEIGKIRKINCGDNADHFDGDLTPHAHFFCHCCNTLMDVPDDMHLTLSYDQSPSFKGIIETQSILFNGICEKCLAQRS